MYFAARYWENFKFLVDLLYWYGTEFNFWKRPGWAIFFHKAINDQPCKLKNSWWQNYLFHLCMLTFLTFTWGFFAWEFSTCSSFHSHSQKKCFLFFLVITLNESLNNVWVNIESIILYSLVVTLWKCQYCMIWQYCLIKTQ